MSNVKIPTQNQTQYRYIPGEPSLKDVLLIWKKDILINTNCHAVATVLSFNPSDSAFTPARPAITAQINYCKTYFFPTADGSAPSPTYKKYSQLVNVPIVVMSGGSSSLTFPIEKGDQCLICFNDRSLDEWERGITGALQPNASARIHSLSDAIAIVGLPTFATSGNIGNQYSPDHVMLTGNNTQVGVNASASKVLITNDPTHSQNLYYLLNNLVEAVKGITIAYTSSSLQAGGTPVSLAGPSSVIGTVASTTNLDSAIEALGNLLE